MQDSSSVFCCWLGFSTRRARWYQPTASLSLRPWSPTACSASSSSGNCGGFPPGGGAWLGIPSRSVCSQLLPPHRFQDVSIRGGQHILAYYNHVAFF